MPRGANKKREREYRELKHKFKQSGRYKGRAEEVASRIVNKQRSEYGETKSEKKKDRQGKSPDRNLPIPEYQHKTISEVRGQLKSCPGNSWTRSIATKADTRIAREFTTPYRGRTLHRPTTALWCASIKA